MIVLCWICTSRRKYLPIRARPCVAHHTNSLPQKSLLRIAAAASLRLSPSLLGVFMPLL